MRTMARLLGVVMLASILCAAQVAPPACPVGPGEQQASMQTPSRPSTAEIHATAAAGAADPTVLLAAEPLPNFGVARFRIVDYANCVGENGCYWADLDAQTKRAATALDHVLQTKGPGEKLAMVLDIDETSLANYCEMKREAFGAIQPRFNEWLVSREASMVIPGTLALFNKARAAGVDVFFITGRADEMRAATERNLEAAGYKGWKGLSLRVGPQKQMATIEYKSAERKKILDAGYRIVMSVGDQWSDLMGEPKAEISVKLPNPFYYLP
jgi:acid phosphatase